FQAEDGIRVFHVTGVQTCALPICIHKKRMRAVEGINKPTVFNRRPPAGLYGTGYFQCQLIKVLFPFVERCLSFYHQPEQVAVGRSEERRVGKEWRCGWWRERYQK